MSKPGTLVWTGLNSPRISAGASGLRSYMSSWVGPPFSQTMMTLFGAERMAPSARRRSRSAKDRPRAPSPPTRRRSRRVRPSQNRLLLPRKFNMGDPQHGWGIQPGAYAPRLAVGGLTGGLRPLARLAHQFRHRFAVIEDAHGAATAVHQ